MIAIQNRTNLFRLFRFDPPTLVGYNYLGADDVQSPQHLRLARFAAQEAMTLYKNSNKTLPLDLAKIKEQKLKVAVIGPQAPDQWLILGNYHGFPTKIVSVLEGMERQAIKRFYLSINWASDMLLQISRTK